MAKRANEYRLTLEQVALKREEDQQRPPLTFTFENHDEIFNIIDKVKEKALFEKEGESEEFAIGLKLFSEVMLKNRKHPLFEEFSPAFRDFMTKLKSS